MKKLIALLLVLFVAAAALGYVAYTALARNSLAEAAKGKTPDTTGSGKGATPPSTSGSGTGSGSGTPEKLETVALETAPAALQEWVRDNLSRSFAGYRTVGKDLFLLVTAGPKPTSGYGVALVGAGGSNGRLEVVVRFTSPAKGTAQNQVITYPYVLAKVPAPTPFKTVEFVEEKPQ